MVSMKTIGHRPAHNAPIQQTGSQCPIQKPRSEARSYFQQNVLNKSSLVGMRELLGVTRAKFVNELSNVLNSGEPDLFGFFDVEPLKGKRGTNILSTQLFLQSLGNLCSDEARGFFNEALGIPQKTGNDYGKEKVGNVLSAMTELCEAKSPLNLYPEDFRGKKIKLQNGEEIDTMVYLEDAAIHFEYCLDKNDIGRYLSGTLKKLLTIAGYTIRDKAYYQNKDNVAHDLNEFRKKLRLELISALPIDNSKVKVKCKNGETVHLSIYLLDAAIELFNLPLLEALNSYRRALNQLLEIAN